MPVTAEGPLAIPFAECRDLFAATARWQSLCAAATAAEAAARIHLYELDPPDLEDEEADEPLPALVLLDMDGLEHRQERIRPARGQLLAEFLLPIDDELTGRDREAQFRNDVGTILTQALALAQSPKPGGGGYWHLTGWWKETAPQVITQSEPRFGIGDALWCAVVLEWME